MYMYKLLLLTAVLNLCLLLPGCSSLINREEYDAFQASTENRLNKINYDLNITKGATNENRGAIEVLQQQIEELSKRLGVIHENMKNIDSIENKFNKKLGTMMNEVVKENERLIKEINKTRGIQQTRENVKKGVKTGKGYYHTVVSGDSLSKIAKQYDVSMESIISANNLENPDSLYIGQQLLIPGSGNEEAK